MKPHATSSKEAWLQEDAVKKSVDALKESASWFLVGIWVNVKEGLGKAGECMLEVF